MLLTAGRLKSDKINTPLGISDQSQMDVVTHPGPDFIILVGLRTSAQFEHDQPNCVGTTDSFQRFAGLLDASADPGPVPFAADHIHVASIGENVHMPGENVHVAFVACSCRPDALESEWDRVFSCFRVP